MTDMSRIPKRPVIAAAAADAPMEKSLVLSMNQDDALLIGPFRIEVLRTQRGRVVARVDAPDQPVVLLSAGRIKVGAHHEIVEQDEIE